MHVERSQAQKRSSVAAVATMAVFLASSGCASIGPGTIDRDRIGYDQAISDSWKQQMLLNLVKLRYGDTPVFLDVASVINSYSLDAQLDLSASFQGGPSALQTGTVGPSLHYSDRPTITYNPLLGEHFTRSLLTPLSPVVVFSMIQSGWRADAVFRITVSAANGVRNRFGGRAGDVDLDFYRLTESLRKVQASGGIGIRLDHDSSDNNGRSSSSSSTAGAQREVATLVLAHKGADEESEHEFREIRRILGLKDGREFRIAYGLSQANNGEVVLLTRSLLEILFDVATWIEVPPAHVAEQRVRATSGFEAETALGIRPLLKVSSGKDRPKDAFVALRYKDSWFWVDDRDYASKQAFSFLLLLSSLTDAGQGKQLPILTIPAG
ncbi:MAG TPA: hypothetical protein VMK12_09215 [Anaeromyxobacteraceae bacterium]|nr:hypothetical protein [Anaeromyxobacteraceae bacterium]